jgi:AcrR family transcriptional regulator
VKSTRSNSRAALIEAAFEEFSSKGYEASRVSEIAERAGVTTGALYGHFGGKLELLLETLGISTVEDLMRSIADVATLPWSDVLSLISEGMATPPDRRMLLLLDVIVVARRDPQVAEILRVGLEQYLGGMRRATKAGITMGLIDPAVPLDDIARILTLLNLGMLIFAALGEKAPSDQAFSRVIDLLFQSSGAGDEQPAALARIQTRVAALSRAQMAVDDAIAIAVDEGYSLRQVAAVAELSHERVRVLIRDRGSPSSEDRQTI